MMNLWSVLSMTYRKCRNPHPTPEGEEPVTMDDVITAAMDAFGWKKQKVMSWYNKENPRLNKSRPSEKVDRGLGKQVLEFLEEKYEERVANERRVTEKK